jgi:hypothetical protein
MVATLASDAGKQFPQPMVHGLLCKTGMEQALADFRNGE